MQRAPIGALWSALSPPHPRYEPTLEYREGDDGACPADRRKADTIANFPHGDTIDIAKIGEGHTSFCAKYDGKQDLTTLAFDLEGDGKPDMYLLLDASISTCWSAQILI